MKRTVMLVVLLVVAFGGSAVAAGKITGKQIKNGSVTGIDIRNGSISARDVAPRTLVAADVGALPPGPSGPDGDPGAQGPAGEPGPNGVPALEYVLVERVVDGQAPLAHATATCPPGKDVLGGGVSTLDPTGVKVVQSAPSTDGIGWFGHVFLAGQNQTTMYVWAACGVTF